MHANSLVPFGDGFVVAYGRTLCAIDFELRQAHCVPSVWLADVSDCLAVCADPSLSTFALSDRHANQIIIGDLSNSSRFAHGLIDQQIVSLAFGATGLFGVAAGDNFQEDIVHLTHQGSRRLSWPVQLLGCTNLFSACGHACVLDEILNRVSWLTWDGCLISTYELPKGVLCSNGNSAYILEITGTVRDLTPQGMVVVGSLPALDRSQDEIVGAVLRDGVVTLFMLDRSLFRAAIGSKVWRTVRLPFEAIEIARDYTDIARDIAEQTRE